LNQIELMIDYILIKPEFNERLITKSIIKLNSHKL